MRSELLAVPPTFNMGFHYTRQYCRRTRVNVMGLVDQSTEEWGRWYRRTHEPEALERMAAAGYRLIETHFLYGFGLRAESEEVELACRLTENAHAVGLKVLGYLQFFSVQEETFFPENPWARDCLQLDAQGRRREYEYDRPALCFSHPQVRQYYLDAVELGLGHCDLDGIRLDNDYFRGCYCPACQEEFQEYLKQAYPPAAALRVFGLEDLQGLRLAPSERPRDPLWAATVRFRQGQRQEMMKAISDKVQAVKPGAILGGNPAVSRTPTDVAVRGVYPPDLGETHHLVCTENSLFPARTGESLRHQVAIYKHGQSAGFKVYPSHHLHESTGRTRWPETTEECALSLCEALCFGGHLPATTWGIRMDGVEDRTLYQRPLFLESLKPVNEFVARHGEIYRDAVCCAPLGVYVNRESLIADHRECWYSLQGLLQVLLSGQVPFRFVDRDEDRPLEGLEALVVPNVRLVSDAQVRRLAAFAKRSKLLLTGGACRFDEHFLRREAGVLEELLGTSDLETAPEKLREEQIEYTGEGVCCRMQSPDGAETVRAALTGLCPSPINVKGSSFVGVDVFSNARGEYCVHLLNYDNSSPVDLDVTISRRAKSAAVLAPDGLGPAGEPQVECDGNSVRVRVRELHTYMVVSCSEAGR